MAKHRFPPKTTTPPKPASGLGSGGESAFQVQLRSLLAQKKYRQAIEEIKKIRRSQPDIQFQPSEAEIWGLRGQQEFQTADFKAAENSCRQALVLGLAGEPHYWLAKSLLALNRLDAALDLIRSAFEKATLPKDFAICYLKLLLLKGDTATVEQLITKQAKRFSAAQLHWVRGVLALQKDDPDTAIVSFQKIKRPVTPSDIPDAWVVYTQQARQSWDAAAKLLGLGNVSPWGMFGSPRFLTQPILTRLATWQQAQAGGGRNMMMPESRDRSQQEVMHALAIVQLIDQGNYHDAGHALLKLGSSKRFSEVSSLRSPLLTLAGQQALTQGETSCAVQLWDPLLKGSDWEPQLAVNALKAFELDDDGQECQRLITRLIKWIEQDARKHPDQWPETRLKLTLAHAHCRLADAWMSLNRQNAAVGEVQKAERICPTSPEVLGRKGLIAYGEKQISAAIALFTQAIDGGCRSREVYQGLLSCWREQGNTKAVNEARRRYGKLFGDMNADTEIELEPWVEALASQDYGTYCHLIEQASAQDPAVRACQIFVEASHGNLTGSGKIAINQAQATQRWAALLADLAIAEQIPVLEAIGVSIQLFAKREKGIAALSSDYMLKLADLKGDHPESKVAHLIVLALREGNNPQRLAIPVQFYLAGSPQPGNALALLQLRLRLFAQTSVLRSFIETALAREPQNPLLLLAKATTYPPTTQLYADLKAQGFDLARRLQDAKALQAFRDEESFRNGQESQDRMPNMAGFDQFAPGGIDAMLEALIRKTLGSKMPRAELERMMPELKRRMLEEVSLFDEFDEEEDYEDDDIGSFGGFDFGNIFGGRGKKRKRSFKDL